MEIKAKYKGKEINIKVPKSEYWNKREKQKTSKYWTISENIEKRLKKEFLKAYKELEKELYTFIGKYGVDGKLSYSNSRVIMLMKEIKPHIENLYEYQQTTITELLTDTFESNYYNSLFTVVEGLNITSNFVKLNEIAIKKAITFPWSGENFSDRIYNNKNKLISTLRQELTQSIIRGDSIKQTSNIIKDRLDISSKNAQRLVRTETTAVIIESSKEAYEAFGLDEYQYIASLDEKTCKKCSPLDGKVFLYSDMVIGINAPPIHANDRCDISPYFEDEGLGERLAKDISTGKYYYVEDIDYDTWYKKYVKK